MLQDKDLLSIQQARQLLECAQGALEKLKTLGQEETDRIVGAMAGAARREAGRLAELAVKETGYGRADHKTIKNLFSAVDVYRYIRKLKTCGVIHENKERQVIDIAVPAGVIAAVIPTTNPTSTAIFKILCALKGRNAIVLSPHPNAMACTIETARVMYEAALQAGAPGHCVGWMDQVTLEGTQELMRNRRTSLILATGGAAMVRAAYSSGKPAYGVGPGNVPAFIERTADIPKAVRDILSGKTFDNGVLCSSEQAIVCDAPIEAPVLDELRRHHAHLLDPDQEGRLSRFLRRPGGGLNTAVVGKSAPQIAAMAGFSVPPETVCLVGRPAGVGPDHPLSMEKLSPILALYVADGWEAGCERCIEILEYGGLGHTMSIHSTNRQIILEFGLHKPAYRICVNTPATLGAVGLTTGVPPSMTLGCGTPGGNITSDNITPLHLINVKRVAFEIRPFESIRYEPEDAAQGEQADRTGSAPSSDQISRAVKSVVDDFFQERERQPRPQLSAPVPAAAMPSPAPTAPLSAAPARKEIPAGPAVDFVCEEDVRAAIAGKQKIVLKPKAIVTPAARDLGEEKSIFVWES